MKSMLQDKLIVDEVRKDYEVRREARKIFDSIWQLNSNFVKGNQYSHIGLDGEVVETDKEYYWQEREVFNHVAPIVDTRLAKLSRVRPTMTVRPSSSDDDDVRTSKVGTKILASACANLELDKIISKATMWSEICGSVFYKVGWDNSAGRVVGYAAGESSADSGQVVAEKLRQGSDSGLAEKLRQGSDSGLVEKLRQGSDSGAVEKLRQGSDSGAVEKLRAWTASGANYANAKRGYAIAEGNVAIEVCPPYEIFPDKLNCQGVGECNSIIHAKAVHIDDVLRIWGVAVKAEKLEVLNYGGEINNLWTSADRQKKSEHCIVLERYTLPSAQKREGELIIVAGEALLYRGGLPYVNGPEGKRVLPFVEQHSLVNAGGFFGTSVVERVIPVQRAYNAIKNRKHEFLNRMTMGVMAVEDGSIDTDRLENEGLNPGKVIIYRQGTQPPRLLDPGSIPLDFTREEDRLLSEFVTISGVSEMMRNSTVNGSATSGIALQLIVEQDDTRLSITAESIRRAIRNVGQMMLRLFKQFCEDGRLTRFVGSEGVELLSWKASDISCDDIIFDTENELSNTPATRQSMLFELLRVGLLHNGDGKLEDSTRLKLLDAMGYGGWENTQDVANLHKNKAYKENIGKLKLEVSELDEHNIHVAEHSKFALGSDMAKRLRGNPKAEKELIEHIREHRGMLKVEREIASGGKEMAL